MPKIIGEVGLSHEGSLGIAISFVEALAAVGANGVKFQMHIPEAESTKGEPFRNPVFRQDKTRFDYWTRTSFSQAEWETLRDSCLENNIEFICTPFSTQAIDRLLELDVKTIKVGSGDFNNPEMIERLRDFPGDLILSTGMATEDEIIRTSQELANRPAGTTTILHCTSVYPTPVDQVSLGYMARLRQLSGFEVGYSDHSGEVATGVAALSLGASCVEAHVVFDKRQFGVDTMSSLTVDEFEVLTKFAANRDQIVAAGDKNLTARHLASTREIFGRSLCLKEDKPAGETLTSSDFTMKKPGGGLNWEDRFQLIGETLPSQVDSSDHLALKRLAKEKGGDPFQKK